MSFKDTELAMDIRSLRKREIMMYEFYSELFKDVSDSALRDRLRLMRKQELGHLRMVEEIIDILRDEIIVG